MADILRLARCNEDELNSFLPTLNDYTLIFTKDTHTLYTKQGNSRVFLGTGSNLYRLDQPILKDFRVYATNGDNIPVSAGKFYGLAGNTDKTYRLTKALQYDGEMLGILEDDTQVEDRYLVNLITNLNVFNNGIKPLNLWDPVFIGRYQDNIISVTDPSVLDEVFGISGVVTEVVVADRVGRYTFNSFLLQSTFFSRKSTDMDAIRALISQMISGLCTKDELDEKTSEIIANMNDKVSDINRKLSQIDDQIEVLDNKFSGYYTKNEIGIKLHEKANISDVYNKTEIEGRLNRKSDKSDTYTKTEVDGLISSSGIIPDPPQKDGVLFAFDKNKNLLEISPENIAHAEPDIPINSSMVVSGPDGKNFYSAKRWSIGPVSLNNRAASITLTGGGDSKEGDLIIGGLWGNSGYGIGVAKNSILNEIQFKNGKLYHTTGSYDNPIEKLIYTEDTPILDPLQYYTKTESDAMLLDKADKSDTYTKKEVDDKISSSGGGSGGGSGIKSFELDDSDKFKLTITDSSDNKYDVNIFDSFIEFNSDGAVRTERRESNNPDVYYWKGKMGINVEAPLYFRHFTTKKVKGCLSVYSSGDEDIIKVSRPFQNIKFSGYMRCFYGESLDNFHNDKRIGLFRHVTKAYVRKDSSEPWKVLDANYYEWSDYPVMLTSELMNYIPRSNFNTPNYPCEIKFTITILKYGDYPELSFVRDWKWGVYPKYNHTGEYYGLGFNLDAKNAIPSNWTGFTTDAGSVTVESILESVKAEHYTKLEVTDFLNKKADKVDLDLKANVEDLNHKANKDELDLKANITDLETKADRSELELKANISDVHLKENTYHKDEVYSKDEVDHIVNSSVGGGGLPEPPQKSGVFGINKDSEYVDIIPKNLGVSTFADNNILISTGNGSGFGGIPCQVYVNEMVFNPVGYAISSRGRDNKLVRFGDLWDGLGNGLGTEWGAHITAVIIKRDGVYIHNGTDSVRSQKVATMDDIKTMLDYRLKVDTSHSKEDIFYTKEEVDTKIKELESRYEELLSLLNR